jgi:hypothetical protein
MNRFFLTTAEDAEKRVLTKKFSDLCELCASGEYFFTENRSKVTADRLFIAMDQIQGFLKDAAYLLDDFRRVGGHRISAPRDVPVGAHQNQPALIDFPSRGLIESDNVERQPDSFCSHGEC